MTAEGDDYTPTTGTICDVYATANGHPEAPRRRQYFWRWYDAEIRAAEERGEQRGGVQALQAAAAAWPLEDVQGTRLWLQHRANTIGEEGTDG